MLQGIGTTVSFVPIRQYRSYRYDRIGMKPVFEEIAADVSIYGAFAPRIEDVRMNFEAQLLI